MLLNNMKFNCNDGVIFEADIVRICKNLLPMVCYNTVYTFTYERGIHRG